MTVEIEEVTEKRIIWGIYKAIFRSTCPGEIELQPEVTTLQSLQVDIRKDPEGFAEFANSIWAALKANQPPKLRKTRSDKGIIKITPAILHTGEEFTAFDIKTGTGNELHEFRYGDSLVVHGKTYKEGLKMLDGALEPNWRKTLSPVDLNRVTKIEEAGKV